MRIHLQESIRTATPMTLADRNGVSLPIRDRSGLKHSRPTAHHLREIHRFEEFDHFLQIYFTITSCLRTADDFQLIAYEFSVDMECRNIRCAEVTFTPSASVHCTGLQIDQIMDRLNVGRARDQDQFGVDLQWLLAIVRNTPQERP